MVIRRWESVFILQKIQCGYLEKGSNGLKYNLKLRVVLVRVCVCVLIFVCVSPCGIYFDSIRGSLHTPCRNQFSHSGPPVATATRAWCWVTWKVLQGDSWCTRTYSPKRTCIHTGSERCFANAENYWICPLVNVASNSLNSNTLSLCASGCTWHCPLTNKLCFVSLKIIILHHTHN